MIMYHIAFFYSNILCYVKLYIVYIVLYIVLDCIELKHTIVS